MDRFSLRSLAIATLLILTVATWTHAAPQRHSSQTKAAHAAREKLLTKVSLQYRDIPLEAVVADLAEKTGVPLMLDIERTHAEGVTSLSLITAELEGETSATIALQLILTPLSLQHFIQDDGTVVITSPSHELLLVERVYDISDLIDADRKRRRAGESEGVAEVIQSTIRPETWVDAGGTATCRQAKDREVLIIQQTAEVHREIGDLLEQLHRLAK